MIRSLASFTAMSVALLACASLESDGDTLQSATSDVGERSIQYQLREAPLELAADLVINTN